MECLCGSHHSIEMEIRIEKNALSQLGSYLKERQWRHVMLVADANTFAAASERIAHDLSKEASLHVCILRADRQGDVVADESAIDQVRQEMPPDVEVLLAVGAGTIHDIVRYVSHQVNKPFIAVPTAPSVDGFTSAGAPIIVKGKKITVQAACPVAVFADVDVLCAAPRRLWAAGVGDMLAKYTSLVDWYFSHVMNGEPYCVTAAKWTRQALSACVEQLDEIKEGSESGITTLMKSLVQSGLAMLYVGHSRPASGAEHHLSHYWEQAFLETGVPQVLHGEKVAVATVMIADLYKRLLQDEHVRQDEKIVPHFEPIKALVDEIPAPQQLASTLQAVGAPVDPAELGISPDLVQKALQEAHHLRDRYTILRFSHEHGYFPVASQ
ncbi:sn-glycerol-1-phosphate dehydrogenase [Brevibacillus migulae]|uniref:sn-glycerol-1-phosphate dehydrogenase n=1 Tax=Brevibacillus migulae TaxID=1644114 RepID=UPI00106E6A79|nr:sn-glycerol-1-phosphate dehydrogenase [Brevibacillus migulae]